MERAYIVDKTFAQEDYTEYPPAYGDYENCSFINCNFSGADLRDIHFSECEFTDCNFSNAGLTKTALQHIRFKGCKLSGLHFDSCDHFLMAVDFDDCTIDFSSFYTLKLKKTRFKNCSLREVDFTETDLTAALFDNCDLALATFDNTKLEKANLLTARNYSIDPAKNKIKKAKFAIAGLPGLLHTFDIVIE